jgi:hypothetical protein
MTFDQDDGRTSIEMLYLSDWMMHSQETEDKQNDYKLLRKKLLSHFREMDADDRIEYSVKQMITMK